MPFRVTPRGVLTTVAAVVVGIVVAVGATAGSYAYLNSTSTVGQAGVTVRASTSVLTLQRAADAPSTSIVLPAAQYRMLPGDIVNQNLTLGHTGATTVVLYAWVSNDGPWEVRIATGPCPASGTLSTPALASQGGVFSSAAPDSTTPLCLQVLLPASAAASVENTALSFTVTIADYELAT